MRRPAIQVQGLGKEYVIGAREKAPPSFREMLTDSLAAPLRRLRRLSGNVKADERFWALKDVGFEVRPGEVLGIIGRNGAGKSTLLKVLSRITAPTEGRVEIRGRIASLLEVGTGFHGELTGRENIYLNGAILGMSRREIDRRFDEIVAFAEVESFIDTPVKRYSSGMYVRLAFAVAAHLEADTLLVDEVLAVGDAEFQRKSLGKMKDVSGEGRTVLFVSHNMGMIGSLCDRCLLLDRGAVAALGEPRAVISEYFTGGGEAASWALQGTLAKDIRFESLTVNGSADAGPARVLPSEEIEVRLAGRCSRNLSDVRISLIISVDGYRLTVVPDGRGFAALPRGGFESVFRLPAYLLRPGDYVIGVGADRGRVGHWLFGENLRQLKVLEHWDERCQMGNWGVLNARGDLFSGVRLTPNRVPPH